MDKLLKNLVSLDEHLASISVSGESVMVMARARVMLKDIYASAESYNKELSDLRYLKECFDSQITQEEKELDKEQGDGE